MSPGALDGLRLPALEMKNTATTAIATEQITDKALYDFKFLSFIVLAEINYVKKFREKIVK